MSKKILVTAGGTSEKIDDVRIVTNISTGRFGAHIADAFADSGCDVTLLKSTTAISPTNEGIIIKSFSSSDSLEKLIKEEATKENFDIVIMAAAVSDYIPVMHSGKLPSDTDTLLLEMRRRSKILPTLRTLFGDSTLIVGFKLLSAVSKANLEQAAIKQFEESRVDFVVANDLKQITEYEHPVMLCQKDAPSRVIMGTKNSVAKVIANIFLEHKNVVI